MFTCAGKTDPPSRFIFSQTSAGKGLEFHYLRSSFGAGGSGRLGIDAGDRPRLEVSTARQDAPRYAGKFVGERDRKHVVMKPFLDRSRLDPGLQPVAFPALRPYQHDPGRLHEQDA